MRVADLDTGASLAVKVPDGRYGYIHVATGSLDAGGRELTSGDVFTADPGAELTLTASGPTHVIGFDLG